MSNNKKKNFENLLIRKNYYIVIYKNTQPINNVKRVKDKYNIFIKKRNKVIVSIIVKLNRTLFS